MTARVLADSVSIVRLIIRATMNTNQSPACKIGFAVPGHLYKQVEFAGSKPSHRNVRTASKLETPAKTHVRTL